MKKTLIASVFLLLTITAFAQDTIVLKDGSRFLAKILNMDADGVHYKIWTNLDGPTWTKSYASIKSVKRQGLNAAKNDAQKTPKLDFSQCGKPVPTENKKKDKAKKQKEKPCITGDEIVRTIDSIYRGDRNNTAAAWRDIPQYINGLPPCIKKQCIEEYYLNQFNNAVTSKNENGIIYFGEIYLYVGGESELPMVSSVLATIFASRGNEQATNTYIDKLKQYSTQNDNMLDEDITKLQKETYALLHPRRLEDDMKGKWVLLDKISEKTESNVLLYSPLILDIRDVSKSSGAYMITPEQKIPAQKNSFSPSIAYNKEINTSQALAFNGKGKYAAIQFASLTIKDRRNNADLAHTMLEDSRKMDAEMNATILTSKANIEDKLAASAMTALTTTAIDVLASNLTNSSKTDEVYNLVLFPQNDIVMNSYVSHISATTYISGSSDPHTRYNDYVKDKRMRFVRWEESDSIFFVSKNRKPITLNTVLADDPLLDEYWQIRKKHSIINPRYSIPIIAATTIGAIMISSGVKQVKASDIRDEYGNRLQNPDGSYMSDDKMLRKGMFKAIFGGVLIEVIWIERPMNLISNREKEYMAINRRNIEKLRRKASASLALGPTYEPLFNTFGANINLSF